ncbi:hypothetical protein HDE_00445 [Halotydeus destructor]|nr:hypothetical protein HDE_00445 [Halotydeus destructor]
MDNLKSALHDARSTNEKQSARVRMLEAGERTLMRHFDEVKTLMEKNAENSADSVSRHLAAAEKVDSVITNKINEIARRLQNYSQQLKTKCPDSSNGQFKVDEDLQLFISPSEMADSVSSFEPSSMVHICKAKTKDLTVVLPLCETAKAKKIDVMMVSPGGTVHKVTSGDQFSDTVNIMDKLTALEANERQLRDQLLNLEWINKQFIQELELHESLLSQKQSNMNEDYIALEETIKNLEHTLDIVQDRKMTLESEQSKVRQAMDKRRTETRPVRPPRIRSRRLSIDGAVDMVQREDSTRSLTACRIELFNPTLDNVLVELEEKEDQLCNQFEQIHNEELEL